MDDMIKAFQELPENDRIEYHTRATKNGLSIEEQLLKDALSDLGEASIFFQNNASLKLG